MNNYRMRRGAGMQAANMMMEPMADVMPPEHMKHMEHMEHMMPTEHMKQTEHMEHMMPPGLGELAPEFTAVTTDGVKSLLDYRGRWLVMFSHPGDFTPVCTTEFIAFAQRYQDFRDRNAELLGLSIDSNPSHIAWIINIYRTTGVEIPFPIIADRDMAIAKLYGMIQPGTSSTETVRNVFFIDPKGTIRAKLIYPLTNGRNIGEILRLLDGLQMTDAEHVATPANWRPGNPTIIPVAKTLAEAKQRLGCKENCIDWYLCYNQQGRLT